METLTESGDGASTLTAITMLLADMLALTSGLQQMTVGTSGYYSLVEALESHAQAVSGLSIKLYATKTPPGESLPPPGTTFVSVPMTPVWDSLFGLGVTYAPIIVPSVSCLCRTGPLSTLPLPTNQTALGVTTFGAVGQTS
jgi:hypothetical protein